MKTFRTLVTILILSIVLSACGGGNTDSVDDTPSDSQRFTFGGSVGDGPITGATITLKNAADLLLATTVSDQQANYSFDISIQPSDFPLTIEATGGIDLVTGDTPDLTLFSIVPNLSANRANLNPHSTLIVEIAKVMPSGLTDVNLAAAKSTVLTKMNFGLDTSQTSDPINVLIEENSVANIIKSSETLAEMIRRTRDALVLLGTDFSTDRVMHILAADLTDGSLDGNGASDSDPRLAAIANLVTGQVAIEAMSNELQVNGADATNAMDNAIQVVLPITTQTTANVLITQDIIIQAQRAVAAAQVVDSNPDLIALSTALANLPSNATASTVTTLLPYGAGISLDQSISMAVTSTDNELTAINSAANSVNSPPGISGTPLLTGAENSAYSFTPSASDPDGDSLTFSVSGTPLWASFNTGTGTLSGTPGFDDAGSYNNIIISVSDGTATTSLASFSITVATTNQPPTIGGNPLLSGVENSAYSFTPSANDPDGDNLTFSVSGMPLWASFNTGTGTLSGIPGFDDAGSYNNIIISVSDGIATTSLASFSVTVAATNRSPAIGGTPLLTGAENSAYSFTPSASDPDGDSLTFSVSGTPLWASFNTGTGTLSGTPGFDDAGSYNNIIISVSDGIATTSLASFSITVAATNQPPTIGGNPLLSGVENSAYSFTPSASDPDGDNLTFSVSGTPLWASFNTGTGTLSGIPGFDDAGSYNNIIISVSDGIATTSLASFSVTVAATNRSPAIGGTPLLTGAENSAYSFTPSASDPDGDSLTFSVSGTPLWASFNTGTGTLSGTPGFDDAGSYNNIIISVSDGIATTSLASFSITVAATNQPPTIGGNPLLSGVENSAYSFTPSASDPDGDNLTFSVSGTPLWASFNTGTGTLSGTPGFDDAGSYNNIIISVSDGIATTSLASFSVTVAATNRSPAIGGTPLLTGAENSAYSFTPSASDPDGDSLTFSVSGTPLWASFNTGTGTLSGTPGFDDAGSYNNIIISVSDGIATTSLASFSITVAATNRSPAIGGTPLLTGAENSAYSFTPSASDPDGDSLTFSVSGTPLWASFNTGTGTLSGTPGFDDAGSYNNIIISVSDGIATTSLASFSITVAATNQPPTIGGNPLLSGVENSAYSFTPSASDPDGDNLTFSVSGTPLWASFNTGTGTLSGTPGFDDAGSYSNIIISVSDGTATTSLASFNITVAATNQPPTIGGNPLLSGVENSAYSFTPSASDPDGDNLTFSVSGMPLWASFNTGTGTLSGTPGFDDAGSYSNIIISVSDGIASASLSPFAVNVLNSNQAPSISGNPNTDVTEGEFYSFTPTASDPDGDNLTFTVANLPEWAIFNSATGVLSGIPNNADIGIYNNISISATDGSISSPLASFAISVNESISNSAHIEWQIPTTRDGGSPLAQSEISGYRIYFGASSSNLSPIVEINDGTATQYTVNNLTTGTHYFSITTIDTAGVESSLSNIVHKIIL